MNANASRISAVTKELWVLWQQTREHWRDARSEEFEKQYLLELLSSVDKTVAVIEELDKLIAKVRRDCE